MRANVIYVQRHWQNQLLSVQPLCPPSRPQSHGTADAVTARRMFLAEINCAGTETRKENKENVILPASKAPRIEGLETPRSPKKIKETAASSATKKILEGMIGFFRKIDPSPSLLSLSLPKIPIPRSLAFLSQGKSKTQQENLCSTEGKRSDKENINPLGVSNLPMAVSALQDFRQEEFMKRKSLCHVEDKSNGKENIPSIDVSNLPTAVSTLQVFRQEAAMKRKSLCTVEDNASDKENICPLDISNPPMAMSTLQEFRQKTAKKRRRQESGQSPYSKHSRELHSSGVTRRITSKAGKAESDFNDTAETSKRHVKRRSLRGDFSMSVHVTTAQFSWFTQLAESSEVNKFLKYDTCRRYADKYLLAMVFTYFARAGLQHHQYDKMHFFAALYLAHDMEEDVEELKYEVFPWALGPGWRKSYPTLLQLRDDIFWSIGCRAVVSKRGCDQVISLQPDSWLWERERPDYHGGAMREHLKDPSDNGRPRGPDKYPLQCRMCLQRECSISQSSYLVYETDTTTSSEGIQFVDNGITTEHKEADSGFETFLFEPCNMTSISPQELVNFKRKSTDTRVRVV